MKPPLVEYQRPETLDEALAVLGELGDDAKPLAGGQSLIPMLNLRLARPSLLVDVKALPLTAIEESGGALSLGALVRHRTLERDPRIAAAAPLLRRVAPFIGHTPIRSRGTLGGSLAHAEPTAELALAAVTLDARLDVASGRAGTREIAAADFFLGPFTSALEPDELLTGVRVPIAGAEDRVGFAEVAQRSGDFALVAAACRVTVRDGAVADAAVALAGVAQSPVRVPVAEQALVGRSPDAAAAAEAARAACADLEPRSDIHASAEFRRHLAEVLTLRALTEAFDAYEEGPA